MNNGKKSDLDEFVDALMTFMGVVAVLIVIFCVILGVRNYNASKNPSSVTTVYLQEYSDGIYARKTQVVSNVPAHNYTIVTVIGQDGVERTVKGSCTIIFTDSEEPYAIIERHNLVYSDKITLYVPQDGVFYSNPVTS